MQKGSMIGKGMSAEVYEWGNDKVLKLYYDRVKTDWIKYEAYIGCAIYEAGVPAPAVYDIIDKDNRIGLIYQRINGNSMFKLIESKPWEIVYHGRQMARLHRKIHNATTINKLPMQKEKLKEAIQQSYTLLGEKTEKIIAYLNNLPDGISICHGDFHPDNIIVSEKESIAIDWTNAYLGNSLGDVARTCLLIRSPFIPSGSSRVIVVLSKVVKHLIYSSYLNEYLKLAKVSFNDIDVWMLPVATARLREKIPGEEKWLLSIIDKQLNINV